MTDNEIIKALECCTKTEFISDCAKCEMFAFDCKDILIENAIDLINRQKAEVERLEDKIFVLENDLEKAENLSDALGNDIDIKLNYIYDLEEKIETVESEAIKEFANRFAKELSEFDMSSVGLPDYDRGYKDCMTNIEDTIDNLVKEMTEEKEK